MVYKFDRLAKYKISQVYKLLVPEEFGLSNRSGIRKGKVGGNKFEDSGNLCTSIIGEAKRGTDDR
jgi:hypothetical protein